MPAADTGAESWIRRIVENASHLSRARIVAVGLAVIAVIGASVGVLAARSDTKKVATTLPRATTRPTTTTVKKRAIPQVARCPLTGLPAPYGVIPQRPALMVKIGNEPGPARPQSGLNEADVVIDTPAEGFIMRYIAIYQCTNAAAIGPTRSVRWVDYHLAPEFVDPILAFAGGIPHNVVAATATPGVATANLLTGQANAGYRTTNRHPPDNLYTSTNLLYALAGHGTRPPKPVFTLAKSLPAAATPLASAGLDFSGGTDVVWQWQPATKAWLHTYSGVVDTDALTGQPVTATNIVIEIVPYTIGPYIESTGGTGDIQSQTTGTGTGYLLRDGKYIAVNWTRPTDAAPTQLKTAGGAPVGLAPGRTWIELITNTQAANGIHFSA